MRGRESDPFRATLSGGATEESVWERSQWRRAVAVLQVQFRWITACQMRTATSFNAARRRWLCRSFPSHVPSRQSASRYWLRLLNGRGPVRNHMPEIAAMDLFVVPTLALNLLYGFIIVRLERI